ncbi:MAG TPA: UPF0280 family protein [Mesorhizobium sp.]|nr:UPF0280 family protein [Mesorhizobium sp.]
MSGPQARLLPGGRRLHLSHGPIDLIVEAWGRPDEVETSYRQAAARFRTVLDELVAELPALRQPAGLTPRAFQGSTAQRMEAAVAPHARKFITPMAAVAGAVADESLAALLAGRRLAKAYVNNGGDVGLHLSPGEGLTLAVVGTGGRDRISLCADQPSRGVATSGWPGRSFSLGIADAVTVLAADASSADAAATVIANAVDLPGHPAVRRQAACEITPDSDLGERPVTLGVGALSADEIAAALDAGLRVAEGLRRRALIHAAALFLKGEARVCRSEMTGMVMGSAPLAAARPFRNGFSGQARE